MSLRLVKYRDADSAHGTRGIVVRYAAWYLVVDEHDNVLAGLKGGRSTYMNSGSWELLDPEFRGRKLYGFFNTRKEAFAYAERRYSEGRLP